jgi:threonine/homoserine/homoserine lactone efflux protein
MGALTDLMLAGLVGLASGFFISIPVGPINATIIHDGGRHGLRWSLLVGLGAVAMETIYCILGFASFSGMFTSRYLRVIMELISFLLLLYLGTKFLLAKHLPGRSRTLERVEERLHPHTAFWTGFVRVLGNPGVLLFWITVSASFISHEWVEPNWPSKLACIGGVMLGCALWFVALSYAVVLGHRHFTDATMLRLSHVSGVFLLVVASVVGFRLVTLLLLAPH